MEFRQNKQSVLFRPNLRSSLDLRALHRLRAAGLRQGRAQRHQQDRVRGPLSEREQVRGSRTCCGFGGLDLKC